MNERLYRAREDRMLLGVLGGISARLGVDPSLVRVAYAIVTLLTGIFPLVIVYFVMAVVIPEAPDGWEATMHAAAAAPPPPGWMQQREPGASPPPPTEAWPAGDAAVTAGAAATAGAAGVTTSPSAAVPAEAGGPGWAAIAPSAPSATPGAQATAPGSPAWGSAAGVPPPSAAPGLVAGWGTATEPDANRHASDARTGAIVGGLVLVGLGSAFLLAQVAPQVDWALVGPVLLIVLGAVLVVASFRRS